MTKCAQCGTESALTWIFHDGDWFCDKCVMPAVPDFETFDALQPKAFMRDDKHWEADIKNRVTLKDGTVARFKRDKKGHPKRYG